MDEQELLQKLLANGLNCTYCYLNSLSFVMRKVTKVFMGATGVLSNGAVIGKVRIRRLGLRCITRALSCM
mgnify:CR=1 FL=1